MPYPSEHSARINAPDKYIRFRRENDAFGSGIDVIWGIKEDKKIEVQAIRFSASKFTVEEAKKWLLDHDYHPISFEPASGKEKAQADFCPQMPDNFRLECSQIDGRIYNGQDDSLPSVSFDIIAYTGDAMKIRGWDKPVIVNLGNLIISKQEMPILYSHDNDDLDSIIGQTDKIKVINGNRLIASGRIIGLSEKAQKIIALSRNGFNWQASVGFDVKSYEYIKDKEEILANNRQFEGPLYFVNAAVNEISFVPLGADSNTSIAIAASAKNNINNVRSFIMDRKELIKIILAKNANAFTQEQLESKSDDELKILVAKTEEPIKAKVSEDKSESEIEKDIKKQIRSAAVAESTRIVAIKKICNGHNSDIETKAITEDWNVEKVELEVLRANRPINTGIRNMSIDSTPQILEAAAIMSGGISIPDIVKMYGEKTVDSANKIFKNRISLSELFIEAARLNGFTPRSFRSEMKDTIKAAFSTMTISGILSNIANKFLLEGFTGVEQTWRAISAIRSVKDFKEITNYRLSGGFEFDEVGPDGEIKHGKLSEDVYTNKAKTYGKMFSITRQDLINDDLDALTVIPKRIGRGGALKLNSVFWTEFMDNSSFFTAGNNNYIDENPLSIDGLTAAELLFLNQTDPDKKPLAIVPRILLAPNALSVTATQLMNSTEIRNTNEDIKYPTSNPHAGKFTVQRSSYLSNAAIAGNSVLAWYLLADPNDLAVIETVFLNGIEMPTVESADADFDTLGIQMRGYFDFGVTKQEFRGGVKILGEAE